MAGGTTSGVNDDYERRISIIETKVDMFIDEIREQNKMRATEIRAMDAKLAKMQESTDAKILKLQESTDAKFSKLEEKLDDMGKHVRILAVVAMIGIGAMFVAVVGIVYSVATKM